MCDARLNNYSLSTAQGFQLIVASPIGLRHFDAVKTTGNLCGRVVHVLIGMLEMIPILGLLVSLFEMAIAAMCKNSPLPGSLPPNGQLGDIEDDDQLPIVNNNNSSTRTPSTTSVSNQDNILYEVPDQTRDHVRKSMANFVFNNGQPDVTTLLKSVVLYRDPNSKETSENARDNLLGRYDVLQVTARMDYNYKWEPIYENANRNRFFIHHAAAINIGESSNRKPPDFKEYSIKRKSAKLDVNHYIRDMGAIFYNVLNAQRLSLQRDSKHVVWIPFGMGAFLRNLPRHDATYADSENMLALKNLITQEFVKQFSKPEFKKLTLHVCMPRDLTIPADRAEALQNLQAFQIAFTRASLDQSRYVIEINRDATDVAQRLANQHGSGTVSLCNAANRKLIGNHWFDRFAKKAVDENIHRRSSEAAQQARLLNGDDGKTVRAREEDELAQRVKHFGGKVIDPESSSESDSED